MEVCLQEFCVSTKFQANSELYLFKRKVLWAVRKDERRRDVSRRGSHEKLRSIQQF